MAILRHSPNHADWGRPARGRWLTSAEVEWKLETVRILSIELVARVGGTDLCDQTGLQTGVEAAECARDMIADFVDIMLEGGKDCSG